MWSGPRTVSTALMRAWENRPDTVVTDEPLYAFYLYRTGLDSPRPGRGDRQPAHRLAGRARRADQRAAAAGVRISYAKHMTHHLLPEVDRARAGAAAARPPDQGPARAARLLRPGAHGAGPGRPRPAAAGGDLRAFGGPVVDSRDLLTDPEGILRALCPALGVPFDAGDAVLAARPAGQRRRVGAATGTTACAPPPASPPTAPGRAAARPARTARRALPAVLRAAARTGSRCRLTNACRVLAGPHDAAELR